MPCRYRAAKLDADLYNETADTWHLASLQRSNDDVDGNAEAAAGHCALGKRKTGIEPV